MFRPLIVLFCFTALFLSNTSYAAQVKAVKGKKILIDMQSETLKNGDVLKIEDASGKSVGLAKVTKVRGGLAEAVIKGKAEKGFKLTLRPPKGGSKSAAARPAAPKSSPGNSLTAWGVMLGYNSATADIKLPTSGTTVGLSGSSFSAKVLMDYPLFSWLIFRGLAGLEQFAVGGVSNSECGGECTAEISYLSADFWGKINFSQGGFRPWVGAGFDVMFPLAKDSTALDKESITNTSVIALGGGFDWMLSDASYLPFQIEYNLYPSSTEVTASAIALRLGYAWAF